MGVTKYRKKKNLSFHALQSKPSCWVLSAVEFRGSQRKVLRNYSVRQSSTVVQRITICRLAAISRRHSSQNHSTSARAKYGTYSSRNRIGCQHGGSPGRIVLLTPAGAIAPTILKELASLPVTFRSVIGNVSYDITVMKMTFGPEGSKLSVGCRFTVPGGGYFISGPTTWPCRLRAALVVTCRYWKAY